MKTGELRRERHCAYGRLGRVSMGGCSGRAEQKWNLTGSGQIVHLNSKLCLELAGGIGAQRVELKECSEKTLTQQWSFGSRCA